MARASSFSVDIDERQLAAADKRLAQYAGRALQERIDKAYDAGTRLLVRPIQGEITAAGLVQTGRFRKSVAVKKPRLRGREIVARSVAPRSPLRHLLIQGHRIVTPGGRDTGRRTTPEPVVDRAYERHGDAVRSFINKRVLDLGETFSAF